MDSVADGTLIVHKGKHAGKAIELIPSGYLKYITENWDDTDYVEAAENELAFRDDHSTHFYE